MKQQQHHVLVPSQEDRADIGVNSPIPFDPTRRRGRRGRSGSEGDINLPAIELFPSPSPSARGGGERGGSSRITTARADEERRRRRRENRRYR